MAAPIAIVDARGRALSLPDSPLRVISLVPSLTEMLVELGLGGRLAGRTRYCIHPIEELRRVPTFGGTKNPDLAGIVAARPDLVLACVEENRPPDLEALEAAGLAVLAVYPRSVEDVFGLLDTCETLFGPLSAIEACRAELAAALEETARFRQALLEKRGGRPRALTLIWKDPWMAAGADTYIHAMMEELGLANAASDRTDYFELSLGQMAELGVDLMLLPDEPYRFGERDATELAGAGLGVGRAEMILLEGEQLSWYGTRSPRALRALARRIGSELRI